MEDDDEKDPLEDQTRLRPVLVLLRETTTFPWVLMERTPEVSLRGLSLLATQTTLCIETLLYQIPTYRFLEVFEGVKKPRANVAVSESKTSPSLRGWLGVILLRE